MKKNTIRWWVILAAVLVVYNVIAFAVPFPKTTAFFVSWVFTMIAIAAQVYVLRTAFCQGEGVRSKFYGFPIARLGVMYLGVQLALGLVFMALGFAVMVPVWIPLVLYVALLGASAVGFVVADVTRDEIVRQDGKLVKDVSRMRSMQAQARMLASINTVPEAAGALEKLAEEFRFSDPVSGEALTEVEARLDGLLARLQAAVESREADQLMNLCQQASAVLAERNHLCKLNKG